MRNICFKKGLVVGIIVLFLGVGFQPALANEVSITKTSDVEDDCECQPVNRVDLLRFKLLLIQLEAFTNIILSKFGHIPEIAEKCEEILDIIHSNRDLYNVIICAIAVALFGFFTSLMLFFQSIAGIIGEDFPSLAYFFMLVALMFVTPGGIMLIYIDKYC